MPTFCDHCGDILVEDVECSLCDSDCITVSGKGEVGRPFTFAPNLDPDEDNIAACDPTNGFGAFLPSYITNPPRCHVFNSANLSNPDDTDLLITFDSERYDTDGMHDNVTNNHRLTFQTAGIYRVVFNCAFAANAVGDRTARIFKQGGQLIGRSARKPASAAFETGLSVKLQAAFEVNDTIRVRTRQDSGGALNVLATRYSPNLTAMFLRPIPEDA